MALLSLSTFPLYNTPALSTRHVTTATTATAATAASIQPPASNPLRRRSLSTFSLYNARSLSTCHVTTTATASASAASIPPPTSNPLRRRSLSTFSLYNTRSLSTRHVTSTATAAAASILLPAARNPLLRRRVSYSRRRMNTTRCCVRVEGEARESESERESEWGKVTAVLFDMDGVLCNSEEPSRRAGVDVFDELGVVVTVDDFVPFMGTGEANFLGGVARVKGIKDFDTDDAKRRFFDIYLTKYAKPNSGIGFPGAFELITQCKNKGLKVAVASSADRIKVDANLAAAGLSIDLFDVIVSADAFENLKPAPDIFITASKILDVPPSECVVIEDALAGLQAAKAAKMRCIVVTTTLSEEALLAEGPSLIRKNIGDITIDDIISGQSDPHSM